MAARELLILGLDGWGCDVLARAADAHPRLGDRAMLARLRAVEGHATAPEGPVTVSLAVPSSEAFRRSLVEDLRRPDPAERWDAVLPPEWLADHGRSLPAEVDDRLRHRHAALAAAARLRRRLTSLREGAAHVLLVGRPSEPLAATLLPDVAEWLRADARAAEESEPTVELLLGLEPLGARAEADPVRAARLHAALADLQRRCDAGADPFGRMLLVANPAVSPDDLAAAAAEAVGWLARAGPSADVPREDLARFRGRSVRWSIVTGATALLDAEAIIGEETRRLAHELGDTLAGRNGPSALSTREQVDRLSAEIASGLQAATAADRKVLTDISALRANDPRLQGRRAEKLPEQADAAAERLRVAGRTFLFGGSINRMSGGVAVGYLGRQLEWFWKLVLGGHARLEDVLQCWNVLAVELPTSTLEERCHAAERELETVAARRLDGAPAHVRLAATVDRVHARARLAQHRASLDLRRELREWLGATVQSLAAAERTVQGLPRAVASAHRPRTSPWRTLIPVTAEAFHRSLAAEGLTAAAWLDSLAPAATGELGQALGRPPGEVAEALRAHVAVQVGAFARAHPVTGLPGLPQWLTRFVDGLPPGHQEDGSGLPGRLRPHPETVLFAGLDEAEPIGGSFRTPPAYRPAGDPMRVGWLSIVGPLPLSAVGGLRETSRALGEASQAGRLRPRREEAEGDDFPEPRPGDLAERLERRGHAEAGRALAEARGEDLVRVAQGLARLPGRGASERAASLLGTWLGWTRLEDLGALGRTVQDLLAVAEPDGSDAELREVVLALTEAAASLQKAIEVRVSTERVAHLTRARDHLQRVAARTETELAGSERRLLALALTGWLDVIDQALRGLRGRAELVAALRSRRLVLGSTVRVVIEVTNRGEHPTTASRLKLLASPRFRVLGEDVVQLGVLAAGEPRRAEFTIKPAAAERLPLEIQVDWDDLEAAGKSLRLTAEAELVNQPPPFRRIERNPYIAGPPVRSEAMFFGRDDVFRYVAENLAGRYQDNVLILHGQRRTGKSSILYQLERRELLPEHVAVLLDLQGLGGFDTTGLLHQLARQAGRRLRKLLPEGAVALPDRGAFRDGCYEAFQEYLDDLEDTLEPEGKRLLFMIDEFDVLADRVDRGGVEPEVFPFLRNLMQHRERVAFLLAGTHELLEMRRDYWSILFSLAAYRKVSYLGEDEARTLVQRPLQGEVTFDDLVVDSLLHLTAGHPYYLQLTCQNLVNHLNHHARHAWVLPEDLAAVLPEVLEAGSGHFEHEWRNLRTPLARSLLLEMAGADDTGLRRHAAVDLSRQVGRRSDRDFDAGEDAVSRTLAQLVDGELLEATGGGHRIRVDLMRQWIRRRKPEVRPAAERSS